jgi:hypothetical protein
MTKIEAYDKLVTFIAAANEQQGLNWNDLLTLLTEAVALIEPPDITVERLHRDVKELGVVERSRVSVAVHSLNALIADPVTGEDWRRAIEIVRAEMDTEAPKIVKDTPTIIATECVVRGDDGQLERTPNTNTD